MGYAIRTFRTDDAPALSVLTSEAIRVVGAARYSDEQIGAWAARHPGAERFLKRAEESAEIFVVVDDDDSPVAYALLEEEGEASGHLDMLYCHPAHTRCGLAEMLLHAAELHARAAGITRLFTEASELARPAFERAGYRVQHRREFAIEHDGREIAIHNYAMDKIIG